MRSLKRPSATMPAHSTPTQTRKGSGIAAAGGAATACPPNTRTMSRAK